MIILDTNIVSEMMRAMPDLNVLSRLEFFKFEDVFTTVITIQELVFGATRVRGTEKFEPLMRAINDLQQNKFAGRILQYDSLAAQIGGRLQAEQKMRGEMVDYGDHQIAAIALNKKFKIATRNSKDFVHSGVEIFNPWETS